MKKLSSFDVLKRGWRLFRCSWKPIAAYTVLVWTATPGVLSLLATWMLNQLIAQSGEPENWCQTLNCELKPSEYS